MTINVPCCDHFKLLSTIIHIVFNVKLIIMYRPAIYSNISPDLWVFKKGNTAALTFSTNTHIPSFCIFPFYLCCLWKQGAGFCLGKLSGTKECWKNRRTIFDRKTPTCCSLSKSCECHVLRHSEWPWVESSLCETNKGKPPFFPHPKIMRWILAKFWLCLFLVSHFCPPVTNL